MPRRRQSNDTSKSKGIRKQALVEEENLGNRRQRRANPISTKKQHKYQSFVDSDDEESDSNGLKSIYFDVMTNDNKKEQISNLSTSHSNWESDDVNVNDEIMESAFQESVNSFDENKMSTPEPVSESLLLQLCGIVEQNNDDQQTRLHQIKKLKITVDTRKYGPCDEIGYLLPKLESLQLINSSLASMRDLGTSLRFLRILKTPHCGLSELDGISALFSLEELYVAFNDIWDLSAISLHDSLQVLDLESNNIEDLLQISQLGTCPVLCNLTLTGCPILKRYVSNISYRRAVCEYISTLKFLDDNQVSVHDQESSSQNISKIIIPSKLKTGLGDPFEEFKKHQYEGEKINQFDDSDYQEKELNLISESIKLFRPHRSSVDDHDLLQYIEDSNISLNFARNNVIKSSIRPSTTGSVRVGMMRPHTTGSFLETSLCDSEVFRWRSQSLFEAPSSSSSSSSSSTTTSCSLKMDNEDQCDDTTPSTNETIAARCSSADTGSLLTHGEFDRTFTGNAIRGLRHRFRKESSSSSSFKGGAISDDQSLDLDKSAAPRFGVDSGDDVDDTREILLSNSIQSMKLSKGQRDQNETSNGNFSWNLDDEDDEAKALQALRLRASTPAPRTAAESPQETSSNDSPRVHCCNIFPSSLPTKPFPPPPMSHSNPFAAPTPNHCQHESGVGAANLLTDVAVVSLLRMRPKDVPQLRTRSDFQRFFHGMDHSKLKRLLHAAYSDLDPETSASKVNKRLLLFKSDEPE